MGHVWQGIVKALAIPSAIEGGDLLVEREDTLWIVEIKSARNTFNSDSRAQAIRKLKERVGFLSSVHRVRPIPVKAMIGMLNGPSRDKIETFKASRFSNENRDIDGFQYRQMVGAAFWRWIVGSENILPYLGDFESIGATIAECRLDAVSRLKTEMRQQLHDLGFPEDISGVLLLKYSALDRS